MEILNLSPDDFSYEDKCYRISYELLQSDKPVCERKSLNEVSDAKKVDLKTTGKPSEDKSVMQNTAVVDKQSSNEGLSSQGFNKQVRF